MTKAKPLSEGHCCRNRR